MWDSNNTPENSNKCIRISRYTLTTILVIIIVGYFGFPVIFRYSSFVKSNLAFLNLAKYPLGVDYHRPSEYGLEGARNFYLSTDDGVSLGIWHSLPTHLQRGAARLDLSDPYNMTVLTLYERWLNNSTVFMYCHGSAGTRASPGRIKLYQLLNRLGYHVITLDYRGYGDSTGQPKTESDVVLDAWTVYKWISKHITTGHIFVWGHSLGTGVLSHLLMELEKRKVNRVKGAILESAFNNLLDALRSYPPSKPYSRLPLFDFFAVEPIADQGLTFRSEEYLKNVSLPLLFLHAEDDSVVPYTLGVKLYDAVISSRNYQNTATFISYNKSLGYGHMKINEDPNLSWIVQNFVEKSVQRAAQEMKSENMLQYFY